MTNPQEEKTHRKRGARQEEEKERSRKRPMQRNQKGMHMTRKEKELRKPQKVTAVAQRTTPSRNYNERSASETC